MESMSSERSLRTPVFDGKPDSFQMWWVRFCAFAEVSGFLDILEENDELPKRAGAFDEDEAIAKVQKAAVKRNSRAMAHLTMGMATEALTSVLLSGFTEDWPNGLAWKIVTTIPNLSD